MRIAFLAALLFFALCDNGVAEPTLTRDHAAKLVRAKIDGNPAAQFAIEDTTNTACWFPPAQPLSRIAEIKNRAERPLFGGRPLSVYDELARSGVVTPIRPVQLLHSTTQGYVYVDCFGNDMTSRATGRSNLLNLNTVILKIELTERTKTDVIKAEPFTIGVGGSYQPSQVSGTRYTVALSRLRLIGITGISGPIAEFNFLIEPTETGRLRGLQSTTRSGQAAFRLYDDGWRMVNIGAR